MWREPETIRLAGRCFLSVPGIKHSDQKLRADFSLHVTIHQCGKSGWTFTQALTGRPACYSTLLCLWPRNSHTASWVQQKPRGNTARWLMRALTQLAFFYSPGPPAQGMGPPRVDWSPLWQLTTKTVMHSWATGQSEFGNSSGEIILWHDVCVVTSWPFELNRILLKNIHQNWTYARLYMSKSWHILVLKLFRICSHITVEITSKQNCIDAYCVAVCEYVPHLGEEVLVEARRGCPSP